VMVTNPLGNKCVAFYEFRAKSLRIRKGGKWISL
jgi:hypothetical protein